VVGSGTGLVAKPGVSTAESLANEASLDRWGVIFTALAVTAPTLKLLEFVGTTERPRSMEVAVTGIPSRPNANDMPKFGNSNSVGF